MRLLTVLRGPDGSTDEGFSLVETLVALSVAAVALFGLLGASVFAVQATVTARQDQQAGDILNQEIEQLRSVDYAALSMVVSDLAGDPRLVPTGTGWTYDPGAGPEPVYAGTTGSLVPHVRTSDTNNGRYTVRRYVTIPAGTPLTAQGLPTLRRISVEVAWTHGRERVRRSSTVMTQTRRGLPLPQFTWTAHGTATTQAKNPGNTVSHGLLLTNLGARDSWSLTATTPGWTFSRDSDADGSWDDDGSEPTLAGPATDLIEPGGLATFHVVAHREIGAAESGTVTTQFSARSVSQPLVAAKAVTTSLTVTAGAATAPIPTPTAAPSPTGSPACTPGSATGTAAAATDPAGLDKPHNSYSLVPMYLTNGPALNDTATIAVNTMSTDAGGLQSQLCNYSTERGISQAGREAGTGTAPQATAAVWEYQPTANGGVHVGGTAAVTLLVQCPTAGASLTARLHLRSAPTTTLATRTAAVPSTCSAGSFVRADLLLAVAGTPMVAKTDRLVLTVTSSTAVRLAYGTTSATSRLTIAVK